MLPPTAVRLQHSGVGYHRLQKLRPGLRPGGWKLGAGLAGGGRKPKKVRIGDAALCEAIADAERGLIAADLGGGVIKQRIARPGQGKSGGFRTLIVFKAGARAFFVHGFAKNERDNIEKDELVALKRLASELLAYDDQTIAQVVASGALIEVISDEKAIQ